MRASSLANARVIDLLNDYFIPVNVDGVYVQHNESVEAGEKAAYRQLFQDLHQLNKQNKDAGKPAVSVGTVHAYVLNAEGKPLDSLHVAEAGPDRVIAMLEKAIDTFKVPKGKPVVAPSPQAIPPKANADDLVFHVAARYLVKRQQAEARKDVDDDLVPLRVKLGGSKSGGWHSVPSEDWLVLKPAQWRKLLPDGQVKVGATWNLDREVAAQVVTRFYPTTENNDLSTNRIDEQSLHGTVTSINDGVAQARLHGKFKMKHAFYPRREDNKMVEAALLGYIEFETDPPRVRSLRLVTDRATYGGPNQHFGAALRLVPSP
jgi:hypothetical protein